MPVVCKYGGNRGPVYTWPGPEPNRPGPDNPALNHPKYGTVKDAQARIKELQDMITLLDHRGRLTDYEGAAMEGEIDMLQSEIDRAPVTQKRVSLLDVLKKRVQTNCPTIWKRIAGDDEE